MLIEATSGSEPSGIRVRHLSVQSNGHSLLEDVSLDIQGGSLTTVIGLSGSGKSTFIRALAGLGQTSGEVLFAGYPIGLIKSQYPLAVGYIPQFATFHPSLTVRELLSCALALRLPPTVTTSTRLAWLEKVITISGIGSLLDQEFQTLSGGQARRVALSEELLGDPSFLLLDELTTGLDIHSDAEIMEWLAELARTQNKTIVLVTHQTEHLKESGNVIFLHQGRLIYAGQEDRLLTTLEVESTEQLFRDFSRGKNALHASTLVSHDAETSPRAIQTDRPPSGIRQFPTLLARQLKLFFRDRPQIALQGSLIIVFPVVVAVFAMSGLPEIRAVVDSEGANIVRTLEQRLVWLKTSVEASSVVSGLVMFQVVLLTLIGANNSAREIAKEKSVLAKELYAGLSPVAYVGSKFSHLVFLCLIQASWMAWFVKSICGFPGPLLDQTAVLFATTLAMATTCLAISAISPTAERASLLSIYLVGFQLPLSGAALALPDWLGNICRPLISAYWGWSGYLDTLSSTRYLPLIADSTKTPIASFGSSVLVLGFQTIAMLILATVAVRLYCRRT